MLLESTLLSNWLFGWIAHGKIPSKDLKKTAHRHTNQQIRLNAARHTIYQTCCQCVVVAAAAAAASRYNIVLYFGSVLLLHFALLQFYFQIQRCYFFISFLHILRIVFAHRICSRCTSHLSVPIMPIRDHNGIYAYGPERHFRITVRTLRMMNFLA